MSCIIRVGEPLDASYVSKGTSATGNAWEMIIVRDTGKGHRDIAIFATNAPSGVQKGSRFKVSAITEVKWGAKQDKGGNWREQVTMNATISEVTPPGNEDRFISNEDSTMVFNGLMADIAVDDDELPF